MGEKKHVISNCPVEWYWCCQNVGSPFSCYSKENYIVKYPLLPLSGFPYRITQYILKFPILIIAEILAPNTLIYKITWACTQEHNWSYRYAPKKNAKNLYDITICCSILLSSMQKSEICFIHLLIIISSRNFSVRFLPLSITMYTLLNHKKAK